MAAQLACRLDAAFLLLNDVRQFMSEQLLALITLGVVLTGREMDIRSLGIGKRADFGCFRRIAVNADIRKIGSKRVFHLGLHVRRHSARACGLLCFALQYSLIASRYLLGQQGPGSCRQDAVLQS